MSHNLTQPEEIDLIWMAMANHDTEMDVPIPEWVQLSGTIRDAERYELVRREFSGHIVS